MGGGSTEKAADGTPRARLPASLSESVYPRVPSALGLPWHTPDYLRRRLADEEGPDGPGPGSRGALAARSELGESLYDTGDRALEKEALELLKEASVGLDACVGPSDAESVLAKERWARRLAGIFGAGRFLSRGGAGPGPGKIRQAAGLLREAASQAMGVSEGEDRAWPGRAGPELHVRARLTLARATSQANTPPGFSEALAVEEEFEGLVGTFQSDAAWALFLAEKAECLSDVRIYDWARKLYQYALGFRREPLGWRHPETATSLARAGDLTERLEGAADAVPFWALALESLAEAGEEFAPDRAELALRLGRELMAEGEVAPALLLLEPALAWATEARGHRDRLAFALFSHLSGALLASGAQDDAGEDYWTVLKRRDRSKLPGLPETEYEKWEEGLSNAFKGLGKALSGRGNHAGAAAVLERAGRLMGRAATRLTDEWSSALRRSKEAENLMALAEREKAAAAAVTAQTGDAPGRKWAGTAGAEGGEGKQEEGEGDGRDAGAPPARPRTNQRP
jgi:tetratricopeptide (TPR) repeat protein